MIYDYVNGNCTVILNTDKAIKEWIFKKEETEYKPKFPDNIDMNISYNCNENCSFCYINASNSGDVVPEKNIAKLDSLLDGLPNGIEIAINFNTSKSSREQLPLIVKKLTSLGAIVNITTKFNMENFNVIKNLLDVDEKECNIGGIGVSLPTNTNNAISDITTTKRILGGVYTNYHLILGLHDILKIVSEYPDENFLVLGYKNIGRARNQPLDIKESMSDFEEMGNGKGLINFDNLALSQLGFKDFESDRYLGNDGSISTYVDLVNMTMSRSSTDREEPIAVSNIVNDWHKVKTNARSLHSTKLLRRFGLETNSSSIHSYQTGQPAHDDKDIEEFLKYLDDNQYDLSKIIPDISERYKEVFKSIKDKLYYTLHAIIVLDYDDIYYDNTPEKMRDGNVITINLKNLNSYFKESQYIKREFVIDDAVSKKLNNGKEIHFLIDNELKFEIDYMGIDDLEEFIARINNVDKVLFIDNIITAVENMPYFDEEFEKFR